MRQSMRQTTCLCSHVVGTSLGALRLTPDREILPAGARLRISCAEGTHGEESVRTVGVCVCVGGWGGIGALFPHKDQVYEIQRSVTIQDFQFERDGIEVLRVGMSGTPIPCNIL